MSEKSARLFYPNQYANVASMLPENYNSLYVLAAVCTAELKEMKKEKYFRRKVLEHEAKKDFESMVNAINLLQPPLQPHHSFGPREQGYNLKANVGEPWTACTSTSAASQPNASPQRLPETLPCLSIAMTPKRRSSTHTLAPPSPPPTLTVPPGSPGLPPNSAKHHRTCTVPARPKPARLEGCACTQCSRRDSKDTRPRRSLRTHTLRWWDWSQGFPWGGRLTSHLLTHSKGRGPKFPLLPERFHHLDDLNLHVKRHMERAFDLQSDEGAVGTPIPNASNESGRN